MGMRYDNPPKKGLLDTNCIDMYILGDVAPMQSFESLFLALFFAKDVPWQILGICLFSCNLSFA